MQPFHETFNTRSTSTPSTAYDDPSYIKNEFSNEADEESSPMRLPRGAARGNRAEVLSVRATDNGGSSRCSSSNRRNQSQGLW
jgi:hypothetical protein